MKFKELLDMYDNWNGTIVVNDYDLDRIVKAKTSDIGFNETDVDYSYLYDEDVVSFGFYDNEFCVRLYYERGCNMKNTYVANTLLYEDNENDYTSKDVIVWFTVPKKWAEKWCVNNEWESLEHFNDEYVWGDSYEMYISAEDDGVILETLRDVVNEVTT